MCHGCWLGGPLGPGQQTGLITWTFLEKSATAPAQILASFSPSSGSWLWAWANESILPEISGDARSVRDWAETHGHHVGPAERSTPTSRRRQPAQLWPSGSPGPPASIGALAATPSRSPRSGRSR
ncbi:DUF6882 domain-containing protein [Streptomyces sp. NPDC002779]|uniref:DUF6882 domain-containing protein n=1 Tax=Streptomyces sp. NPDC002779 TaxID=3364664 RepID=UPI0036CE9906